MASPRTRRLRNLLLALATLGLGLWLAGNALWQLVQTAVFVHESIVVTGTVTDMRRKPFESWSETLGKGHWSMPGDASYQPTVRFTLPGGINAIRIDMDVDNVDYQKGQTISIISPPGKPGKARINRWKFLWAEPCLHLAAGTLLSLIGYGMLRRLRAGHMATAAPGRKAAAPRQARRKSGGSRSSTGSTPRRRKKAEAAPAATATSAKPRRSRKKKAEPQQAELPL